MDSAATLARALQRAGGRARSGRRLPWVGWYWSRSDTAMSARSGDEPRDAAFVSGRSLLYFWRFPEQWQRAKQHTGRGKSLK